MVLFTIGLNCQTPAWNAGKIEERINWKDMLIVQGYDSKEKNFFLKYLHVRPLPIFHLPNPTTHSPSTTTNKLISPLCLKVGCTCIRWKES